MSTTSSVAVKIVTEAMQGHRRAPLSTLSPTPRRTPTTAPSRTCAIRGGSRHPGAMTHPADCEWAAFTDHAPWVVDRDQTPGCQRAARLRAAAKAEVPAAHHDRRGSRPAAVSSPSSPGSASRSARGCGAGDASGTRDRGRPQRHLAPAAPRRRAARADLHQARPDHLLGRRAVPGRARRGVQEVPRPGSRRAVRRRAAHRRGGPRAPPRGRVRVVRRDTAGRGVDRPGARGTAAHRRGGRRQGAAAVVSRSCATTCA